MIDDRMLEEILNDSNSPRSFTGIGFGTIKKFESRDRRRNPAGERLGGADSKRHPSLCELCNALTVGCQSGLRWRRRNPSELSGSCRGCRWSPTAASEPAGCSGRKDKRAGERRD